MRKILFAIAFIGVLGGCVAAYLSGITQPALPPAFNPATNPYPKGIYANGIVESDQPSGSNISMYPEVSGTVKQILAGEGRDVKKGTLLLQIDDSIQRATVEQLESQTQAAFSLLDSRAGAELIAKLWENTRCFQKGLLQQGFAASASETPISPIHVGDAAKAFEFSRELFKAGVYAPAVGFPTVAEGKARLRAIVTATHTRRELDRALEILGRVARKLDITH
jgi:multidrug efflux pump subunit AcrA (membrane-fusion protein)